MSTMASSSNHQPHECLLNRLFIQAQIKFNIKAPRHWPLRGEITGEFPAQRANNAENDSIWWRHHGACRIILSLSPVHLSHYQTLSQPYWKVNSR